MKLEHSPHWCELRCRAPDAVPPRLASCGQRVPQSREPEDPSSEGLQNHAKHQVRPDTIGSWPAKLNQRLTDTRRSRRRSNSKFENDIEVSARGKAKEKNSVSSYLSGWQSFSHDHKSELMRPRLLVCLGGERGIMEHCRSFQGSEPAPLEESRSETTTSMQRIS